MSNKVLLVGHCGADGSYLKMAIRRALPQAQTVVVDDEKELAAQLADGPALVLVNRLLDYGYADSEGVSLIARYAGRFPDARFMMVSNYDDAQAQAEQAGGVRGFGKRELGTTRVTQLLADAFAGLPAAKSDAELSRR